MRKTEPKEFFTDAEQDKITRAIAQAEKETSGEICVRIDRRCPSDAVKHAGRLLRALGYSSTKARTAVLIYICLEDRQVAIYGDEGIHQKIGDQGWEKIRNHLVTHFRQDQFLEGVIATIAAVGAVLKEHFPCAKEKPNELPDKPSFG
jgi:Predicted membrane protein